MRHIRHFAGSGTPWHRSIHNQEQHQGIPDPIGEKKLAACLCSGRSCCPDRRLRTSRTNVFAVLPVPFQKSSIERRYHFFLVSQIFSLGLTRLFSIKLSVAVKSAIMAKADTKTKIVADGLRYKSKVSGSPFTAATSFGAATMSCFLCGKHRARSQMVSKKILGKSQAVCSPSCKALEAASTSPTNPTKA